MSNSLEYLFCSDTGGRAGTDMVQKNRVFMVPSGIESNLLVRSFIFAFNMGNIITLVLATIETLRDGIANSQVPMIDSSQ